MTVLCWVIGSASALIRGQDASGDHQISHVAAVWTLLHPAQDPAFSPPSWIPGTLNVLWFLVATHAPAWAAVAFLGALHATNLALVGGIAWQCFATLTPPARIALSTLSAGLAATGAAALTEFATTFSDLSTSLFVLAAVALWLSSRRSIQVWPTVLAGAAMGAALGLKLTNLVYVIGFALAIIVFPGDGRRRGRLRGLLLWAAGVGLGGVASAGWLWIHFFRRFGSPIFPFLNGFWGSTYAPPVNGADTQYIAATPLRMLGEPWLMALRSDYPSENVGRDLRWGVLATLAVFAVIVTARRLLRQGSARRRLDPPIRFVLSFIAFSWMIWMIVFGIARYLVAIELLSGIAMLGLVFAIVGSARTTAVLGVVIFVATAVWVQPPSFARQSVPDGDWFGFRGSRDLALPNTLVVLADPARDYTIQAFGSDATFVTLPDLPGRLRRQTRTHIALHQGPVVSVTDPGDTFHQTRVLRRLGLRRTGPCHLLQSNFVPSETCLWINL